LFHRSCETQAFQPGLSEMPVVWIETRRSGWISDRHGYRYDAVDPLSGHVWPAMPPVFADLSRYAAAAAGYEIFDPDACLGKRYEPGETLAPPRS
jgi:alkylated DNA repair protein (DNA oxidative demethylase)